MIPANSALKNWLWLALGVAACAISWSYMHRVLLPWEYYVNVTRGTVKSQMGDLYPRWVGTRELLFNGKNPYSAEVSHEIQMAFYGHAIEQTYDKPASEIVDEQRFAYPVYVVFLMAPTVYADFDSLQNWAPVVLSALVAATLFPWLAVLRWRPPPAIAGAVVLLVLSSPQIAQGLRLRQIGLFVAFLLALASWCVIRRQYFLGGVLLAVSTIKPQMVALCLVWFLIWTLGEWRKRWPFAAGFGITLAALVIGGELLVPGWLRYFLEGLAAYRKYFPTTSIVRLILGDWVGGGVSILAVVALIAFSWSKRRTAPESAEFIQMLALFFTAASLILPLLTPYNQVLLLLPLLLLAQDWSHLPRWGQGVFAFLVAWPSIVSLPMLIHPPQLQTMHRTALLPSALLLLFPFLMLWFMLAREQVHAP